MSQGSLGADSASAEASSPSAPAEACRRPSIPPASVRRVDPHTVAKRAFDLAGAGAMLALTWPLMLLLAAAIRMDSSGGALFRQVRLGRCGRPYELLKFRTMVANADAAPHRDHVRGLLAGRSDRPWAKLEDDPRVTRVGRWLRRTGLDELPQLLNVLRGEMSLVGPRPALPYEAEGWLPWHHRRLAVLPGVTGLWQVEARGRSAFDEMVRMDIEYIERRSLWLDLAIVARTPAALVRRSG